VRRLQGLRGLRRTGLRRERLRRSPLRRRSLRRRSLRRRSLRRRSLRRSRPLRRGPKPMRLRSGRGGLRRLWLQLLGLHGNLLVMGHRGLDLGLLMGK